MVETVTRGDLEAGLQVVAAARTLNWGIIGCGMMGQEHLRNITLVPGAEIAAIFEPDADMRRIAGAMAPGAAMVDSVEALLARPELDCLLMASPNHLHVQQMEEIAARRPLPLLVEKPLYTNASEAARVEALAARYPLPIWVAMEYRYMPAIATFLEAATQATGGVRMLTIHEHRYPFLHKVGAWNRFNRYTGGTLVEKCCHFFDLMRLVIGTEPVRLMASAGQAVNHKAEVHDGEAPDVWDSGYVIVDFDGGARAMLELCMFAEGSRYQEELAAMGPAGKIEALVPGPQRLWPAHLGAPPIAQVVVSPRAPKGPRSVKIPVDPALLAAGDHNGSTFYQHVGFAEVVRGNGRVAVTLADGAKAAAMGLAAQESASTGRPVEL